MMSSDNNGNSCDSSWRTSSSSVAHWPLHPAPPPPSFRFQSLLQHRQRSLCSLLKISDECEERSWPNCVKDRANTTSGVEEQHRKESTELSPLRRSDAICLSGEEEAEEETMLVAAYGDGENSQDNKQYNSGSSTPRQQRRKRSAAERRASNRNRSNAVNDPQLAQLLNGLQHQRLKSESDEEDGQQIHNNNNNIIIKPFSPITDHPEEEEELNEPPEPSVPAPGEDYAGEFGLLAQLSRELEQSEADETQGIPFIQSTPNGELAIPMNRFDVPMILESSFQHRRSISADHLLHSVALRRGLIYENDDEPIDWEEEQAQLLPSSPNNMDEQDGEEGIGGRKKGTHNLYQPNLSHSSSMAFRWRNSPMVAQIQKQRMNNESSSTNSSRKLSAQHSEPECHQIPKFTISSAGVDSLSGSEANFPSGSGGAVTNWLAEMAKSSEDCDPKQGRKAKRRDTTLSTISAPCSHATPSCSNTLALLVDRFTSRRQYSDSNLLQIIGGCKALGEEAGRRSFKWKTFWGRREEKGKKTADEKEEVAEGRIQRRRGGSQRKKNSFSNGHNLLGPLAEDNETVEDRERKKKLSIQESPRKEEKKGEKEGDRVRHTRQGPSIRIEETSQEEGDDQQKWTSANSPIVRMRANSSTEDEEKRQTNNNKLEVEDPKGIADQRRPFSLIGSCDLDKLEEETDGQMARMRRTVTLKDKYRVQEEDSRRLELFMKERKGSGDKQTEDEEESESEEEEADGRKKFDRDQLKLIRNSRRGPLSPTIPTTTQNRPKHLQRMISVASRVNYTATTTAALNSNSSGTLTMPRKKSHKGQIVVVGTLKRKKGGGIGTAANLARRKSSHVTKAQVMMAINSMKRSERDKKEEMEQQEREGEKKKSEEEEKDEGDEFPPDVVVRRKQQDGEAKASGGGKQRGTSVSTSSLRQLLGGGGGSERKGSRGKVAPKGSGGNSSTMGQEKERLEKEKKREQKTNSVILGTIWSIRPKRKKENTRSLANLFSLQQQHQGQKTVRKDERTSTDGDALPKGIASPVHSPHLAPPTDSFHFDPTPSELPSSPTSPTAFARPQLITNQWNDLELWAEEEPSWAAKFVAEAKGLETAEKKRQNIIYELMLTEKNHCQVLVLLRQVYQDGLLRNGLLSKEVLKELIPDVLDTLLDFHLSLLRRLRERCAKAPIVQDISDIVCEEFGEGQFRNSAIGAYTTFCLSREQSNRVHAALMAQKMLIRKFFEFHENEYRDRSFKACMLLIAQRLTKYPILIEQILKYESSPIQRQNMQKAHSAVKAFALEINNELMRHERRAQWEEVKKALDKGSAGKLIDPKAKEDFTYADLVEPVDEAMMGGWGRKVHLVQKVYWRETMTSADVELRLLLCDDIIVFLRPKCASSSTNAGGTGGSTGAGTGERKESPLQFFRHNSHSGVLPLYNTLVKGENLRRKSLLLIVTDREQPDLIQLVFPTSPELEQCVLAIKQAKTNAPKFVRLSQGRVFELGQRSIGEGTSRAESEYQQRMDLWQGELENIFAGYNEDSLLVSYFDYRMTFFDSVRAHLRKCPLRLFSAGEDQQKRVAERERERLSLLLKAKFRELGEKRNSALAKLVDRAQRARDADLPSFFDDLYDLGAAEKDTPPQSSSSDDPLPAGGSSSDSSEAAKMAAEEEKRKPRRVRTYHGRDHQSSSSTSGGGGAGHPIRRNTTVPAGKYSGSTDDEEEEADEEIRKLPLKMNPISRKAATEIIRDNIRLRTQNDRLKKQSALKDLQLVSLRSRKGPSGDTPERLESLRQKQEELQTQKREFKTECERREQQLEMREEELRRRAEELEERMRRMEMQTAEQHSHGNSRMDIAEAQMSANGRTQPSTPQMPTKTTPNSAMRINNTYCGAGPVPRPALDQHQQMNSDQCSAGTLTPSLADRRAHSQMELPRHLAVKTETISRQADKLRKMRKN